MIPSRIALLFPLLCGSLANGADVRYNVLHLQEAYGEELFFYGMSQGGLLTAQSPTGYTTILGNDVRSFPYPFDDGGFQGFYGDTGVIYTERYTTGANGEAMVSSVYTIDRDGMVTDTGYVPRGTSLFLGRQNSLGTVVGDEEGGAIPASAGFLYTPGTGGQSFETLGGVNVGRFSAINDNGWIVGLGVGTTALGEILADGAVLWIPGQPALELRRGSDSPVAINNAGQVIGHDGADAWFWDGNTSRIISDIFVRDPANPAIIRDATGLSGAFGINDAGLVTGFSEMRLVPGYDGPMGTAAWIWSVDEGLLFLEDLVASAPGVHLQGGIGIANDGTLLVSGMIDGVPGVQHFLLTPIPEPCAALLLLAACLPTLFRRKR